MNFSIPYADLKALLMTFYNLNAPYNVIKPLIAAMENAVAEDGSLMIDAVKAEQEKLQAINLAAANPVEPDMAANEA